MITDVLLIGSGAFGVGVFGFVVGMVAGQSGHGGAVTLPLTHVNFDRSSSDEERLRFLDLAAQAVSGGQLRKSKQFGYESASNEGE